MTEHDAQLWTGIALLALAGVLLFGPMAVFGPEALGPPYSAVAGAIAVLGLAAGAVLVGTAEDGRPV